MARGASGIKSEDFTTSVGQDDEQEISEGLNKLKHLGKFLLKLFQEFFPSVGRRPAEKNQSEQFFAPFMGVFCA